MLGRFIPNNSNRLLKKVTSHRLLNLLIGKKAPEAALLWRLPPVPNLFNVPRPLRVAVAASVSFDDDVILFARENKFFRP